MANSNNDNNRDTNFFCPLHRLAADGVAFLRRSDLATLGICRSKTTLHRWMQAGHFPRPVYPGQDSKTPLWPIDEVIAWDNNLRATRPA
ncbi:helix-turn-helix transcriptional regulator [Azospirillum argentinense]